MKIPTTCCYSALAIGWSAVVFAAEADFLSPDIDFFEAGVLCAQDGGVVRTAPDTVAGTTHVVEDAPDFVSTGRMVPAVLGTGFGARSSMMSADGETNITMTVTHPAFAGSGATQQSFITSLGAKGDPGMTFYQFDYGYELVLGDWTMSASANGVVLYEVTFTVVPPGALPELANTCGYVDLLG